MSKAFTREPDNDDDDDEPDAVAENTAPVQTPAVKNYITPSGLQRLKDEHVGFNCCKTRSFTIAACMVRSTSAKTSGASSAPPVTPSRR